MLCLQLRRWVSSRTAERARDGSCALDLRALQERTATRNPLRFTGANTRTRTERAASWPISVVSERLRGSVPLANDTVSTTRLCLIEGCVSLLQELLSGIRRSCSQKRRCQGGHPY